MNGKPITPSRVALLQTLAQGSRLRQFIKFCVVGGSGVVVDMTILHLLAHGLGWNVSLSKLCSAEAALLNNFLWNEVWTFRSAAAERVSRAGVGRRLWWFHAICGAGIGLAVFLLHLFYRWLGIDLYVANLLAIVLVTFWNFWLNALFNWQVKPGGQKRAHGGSGVIPGTRG